jgi:hypothetical protein
VHRAESAQFGCEIVDRLYCGVGVEVSRVGVVFAARWPMILPQIDAIYRRSTGAVVLVEMVFTTLEEAQVVIKT